jgi:hypothetical protein
MAALVVAVASFAQASLWPEVVAASRGMSTTRLTGITTLLVGAIGLPAGLCFPVCLEVWGRRAAGVTASLYTVNALATVLGASLAALVSMGAGLTAAMAVGGAAYGLVALTAIVRDSR